MSNRYSFLAVTLIVTATCALALSSRAQTTNNLVNDTWLDGTRTDPASPTYAENNGVVGTDADADGNLESAWFNGGKAGDVMSSGHMVMTNDSASSSTFTTWFTPAATPVTLANPGDEMTLTWVFTPNGVNVNNGSQAFLLAVAKTPTAGRLTADGTPASQAYAGYSMFMNMGQTLGNGNPFALKEFVVASGALLGTSANWGANGTASGTLTNGAASGNHGYDSGTQYTYNMTLTRDGSGNLDITSTMIGGTLNGSGTATVSYVDSSPNSFSYDTFQIRPANGASSAATFDTTLFQVQFITVPEPSTVMLVGAGLGLMLGLVRRRRS